MSGQERPVLHEYIRYTLYTDLTIDNVEEVLLRVRKLPWNDEPTRKYLTKSLTRYEWYAMMLYGLVVNVR